MESDDLDLSWIQEEEQLLAGRERCKLPMKEISVRSIYIDSQKQVVRQEKRTWNLSLEGGKSVFRKTDLRRALDTDDPQYQIDSLLLYHVDVDLEHLQMYIWAPHLHELVECKQSEDLWIEPALPPFHSIHELFALYREILPKSILKPKTAASSATKKRVRIADLSTKQTRRTNINP
jgi:hypothetical protein